MPMHTYYDENFLMSDASFEEFDPNVDDPHNPRASVRMLQSAGCLTLVTALLVAAAIGGCYSILKNNKKEQQPQTEQKETPKKVSSFVQRVDTYSGVIKQYGE